MCYIVNFLFTFVFVKSISQLLSYCVSFSLFAYFLICQLLRFYEQFCVPVVVGDGVVTPLGAVQSEPVQL